MIVSQCLVEGFRTCKERLKWLVERRIYKPFGSKYGGFNPEDLAVEFFYFFRISRYLECLI